MGEIAMCYSVIREIMSVSREELEKYTPEGSLRVDFLKALKEKLATIDVLGKAKCIVGLAAPTGAGKTSFLVGLSMLLASKGYKVSFLTAGKANRASVAIRFTEAAARLVERGLKPPKVSIVFSKIDTCINPAMRDVINAVRTAEENGDYTTASKYAHLFYTRCSKLAKSGACSYYVNARQGGIDKILNVLDEYTVYIVSVLTPEIMERLKHEAPTAWRLMKVGKRVIVDVSDVAKAYNVCPYELSKAIASKSDIVVVDSVFIGLRGNELARMVFGPDRVVIVDEVHEAILQRKVMITFDYRKKMPNPLATLGGDIVADLRKAIEMLFSSGEVGSEEFAGVIYQYAVPKDTIPSHIAQLLRSVVRRAVERFDPRRHGVRVEGEISALSALLSMESESRRVSLRDNSIRPGVTVAVREVVDGKIVREHLIPVLLSPRLRPGVDFSFAIAASATLMPDHLTLTFKVRRDVAEKRIAVVEWDVVKRNRLNIMVSTRAYYEERPVIAEVLRELMKAYGPVKLVVVASSSWSKYLKDIADSLGMLYIQIVGGKTVEGVEKTVATVRAALSWVDNVMVHVSPHTSISKGEDFVPPNTLFNGFVFALSESIQPVTAENVAERAILVHKYKGFNPYWAWLVTNVSRSIMRVVQAIGRVQRSENHRITVVYIGRFYKYRLPKYYEKLYGSIIEVYNNPVPDPSQIVSSIISVI